VFFETPEALVPNDTNEAQDVYEYEDGHARLISSGTGGPSTFFDASENGNNAFFTTVNQLVPQDTDQLTDLYDARVNGGFPTPATPPACTGTGCQGTPAAPPIFATPSSATFNGVGNFTTPPAAPVVKPKTLTRAQQLAAALRLCEKHRAKCLRALLAKKNAHKKRGRAKKASAKKRGR
jgi:hypothetical protein